jgi:putative ABC transport system permease protein
MEIVQILSSLQRGKIGALVIVIQIALTMMMISNVASIVASRAAFFMRPTGMDEANLFATGWRFTKDDATQAMLETDIHSVLSVPGVVDMVSTNSYPIRGHGLMMGVGLTAGESAEQAIGGIDTVYAMDNHAVTTMGLQLVAGRNFRSDEILTGNSKPGSVPQVAIITAALAKSLFGNKDALDKVVYLTGGSTSPPPPLTVIGIVNRLQGVMAAGTLDSVASENSIILPIRTPAPNELFVIRVKAGSLEAVMPAVQAALVWNNPRRIFGRLRPYSEVRASAYEKDRAISIALMVIAAILVCIAVLSVSGLTFYWVMRRRLQIGIRRALGATRAAIIRYFLVENAVLCLIGVGVGSAAALAVNRWLFVRYGVGRIPIFDLLLCCVMILVVGQLAAVVPAARAAKDDPAQTLRVIQYRPKNA